MGSLLRRCAPLVAVLLTLLIACPLHRWSAWCWACACVWSGDAPAQRANVDGALCAYHETHDDAQVVQRCQRCLVERGLVVI